MKKPKHYWQCRNEKKERYSKIDPYVSKRMDAVEDFLEYWSRTDAGVKERNRRWREKRKEGWDCIKVHVLTEAELSAIKQEAFSSGYFNSKLVD